MSDKVVRIATLDAPQFAASERIGESVELIYSPLDGGFYFQSFDEGESKVSATYPTRHEALATLYQIEWETGDAEELWQLWKWAWGLEVVEISDPSVLSESNVLFLKVG